MNHRAGIPTSVQRHLPIACALAVCATAALSAPASAQVDPARAAVYFEEAARVCERDGGKLWGISLCGPMVLADAATKTIATNQPAPEAARPPYLGYSNAALEWGGVRWSTFVWQMIPAEEQARACLLLHELFHRVQPELGLMTRDGQNGHLDTLEGRVWLQLEWRALAAALGAEEPERSAAVRDALAFRAMRRELFADAAENERLEEIREGLAQYTGTVLSTGSAADAANYAIQQLAQMVDKPSFVRTFAYPLGAAYGILLDAVSPGWTREVDAGDDLGRLLAAAAKLEPSADADAAAKRYGVDELRAAEEKREAEHRVRLAELRARFVDGPVLVVPGAPGAFVSTGVTALPGAGTVYPGVRVTAEWGRLEAESALRSDDKSTITLPAPERVDGATLSGAGWTLELAPGWVVRAGTRAGDFALVREG